MSIRIQMNSYETCCCTICATLGCNCHTVRNRGQRGERPRRPVCWLRPAVNISRGRRAIRQRRRQVFVKGGRSFLSPSWPIFLSLSPLPPISSPRYKQGSLNQLEGLGERCISSPSGVRSEPRPKTNLVHSKAVRKPRVAIIFNILSNMFYSRTINLALANMTVTDGVSPSPKGAEPARPPSKSATVSCSRPRTLVDVCRSPSADAHSGLLES